VREKAETTPTREVCDTFPADFLFLFFFSSPSYIVYCFLLALNFIEGICMVKFSFSPSKLILLSLLFNIFKINLSLIELTNKVYILIKDYLKGFRKLIIELLKLNIYLFIY